MSVDQKPQKILHEINLSIIGHHRLFSFHHYINHEINYENKAGSIVSIYCPADSRAPQVSFALKEIQSDILDISDDALFNFSFIYKQNKNALNGILIQKDNVKADEVKTQFENFYSLICGQLNINPGDHIALTMGKK